MPTTVIEFSVEDPQAVAAFNSLQREVSELESGFGKTQREASATGTAIENIGTRARRASRDVRQMNDRLRDAQDSFRAAGRGADTFTASLNSMKGLLTELAQRQAAQFAANANALGALTAATTTAEKATETATRQAENFGLALATLKADAEDTRSTLQNALNVEQVTPNFQAAIAASNAYYQGRIAQAEKARAAEQEGSEKYQVLQTRIFELGRQRTQSERQLETERRRALQQFTTERVGTEREASHSIIFHIQAITAAARASLQQRLAFAQQIAAIPDVNSPAAAYGRFGEQQKRDFAETASRGQRLLSVMHEIVKLQSAPLDLENRIPDPLVRDANIDARLAAEAQGARTLHDIRQAAAEQGQAALNRSLRQEERAVQKSLQEQARQDKQFSNLVANTFVTLATGRSKSFDQVAQTFMTQSLRIVARAVIENQIRQRLDDALTAHRIANIHRVAAAQNAHLAAAASGGLGNLGGFGLSSLGGLLSGGGGALGIAGLLFPQEMKNLTSGITDAIGGLIANVADAPDKVFAPKQTILLKIGDNEIREIQDETTLLEYEDRL